MDSKTLNEGVPTWLLAHKQLGSRAWKQKKNQLLLSEGGLGFALVFSKGSMRSVEPWQRVGVLLDITLEVTHPALAKVLGLSEKSVIVSVQIQPRNGSLTQRWQTSEETVDALATEVGARLSGILDELVRVLAHPAGFESLVAQAYNRRTAGGSASPRAGLAPVALKGCYFVLFDNSRPAPFLAAALLLRHDHAGAEALATAEERVRQVFDGSKSIDVWPSLLAEIDRQRAAKAAPITLPAADWDFGALEARLDAAVVEAIVPVAAATAPAVTTTVPVTATVPTTYGDTPFGRLCALLAMPTQVLTQLAQASLVQTQWAAARNYLHQRTLTEAEEAELEPLLSRIDGGLRTRGTWNAGTQPAAWRGVRHAYVPRDESDMAETVTHANTFDAHKVDWSTCPVLESLSDLNCRAAAPIIAALKQLPSLRALDLRIDDEVLSEVVASEGAKQVHSWVLHHHKPYDKAIKALAKSGAKLKRLRVEAMSPAAAKALSKSASFASVESFGLRLGTEKQVESLTPVLRTLSQLRALFWECAVDSAFVLPATLESLALGNTLSAVAALNPALPALRHLRLIADPAALQTFATWAPTAQLEELSIGFHGDFSPLTQAHFGALHTLDVDALVGKDFDSLLTWLKTLPKLRSLRLRFPMTREQATGLCAALPQLEALDVASPHMLAAMSEQVWPNLRAFVIDVRESTGVVLPFNDAFADKVLAMPSLSAFAVRNAEDKASSEKRAALEAKLASVCIGNYWP